MELLSISCILILPKPPQPLQHFEVYIGVPPPPRSLPSDWQRVRQSAIAEPPRECSRGVEGWEKNKGPLEPFMETM